MDSYSTSTPSTAQQNNEGNLLYSSPNTQVIDELSKSVRNLDSSVNEKLREMDRFKVEMGEFKVNLKEEVKEQKSTLSNVQTITILGFILALFLVGAMVFSVVDFEKSSTTQIYQQTQLLQQIKDKIAP